MIKINRPAKPIELTEEVQKQLTKEFKNNKEKSVWKKKYITDTLFKMSHGKCCYCEMKLAEEGKFMNVEHYHHKNKYKEEVVDWDNLLPSCGRCNNHKRDIDTKLEPIINPAIDNPKDYLVVYNFRYKSKNRNKLGQNTIDILCLNSTIELVKPRIEVCIAIFEKLERIREDIKDYKCSLRVGVKRRNTIIDSIKRVLSFAQPTESYSAIVSNAIMNDSDYKYIKETMLELNLWNNELEELESIAKEIMLDSE